MAKFFKVHFLSLIISLGVLLVAYFLLPSSAVKLVINEENKTAEQITVSGVFPNLNGDEQNIIDYLASIQNTNQLTLFGSSEFNYTPYATYKFFPNKMGRQVLGIGHAHHQHLSILIELLAATEYLDNSKVCIFLSPGWFQGGGTNSSAFVEFAKPELLSKIIANNEIDEAYKHYIGQYIAQNKQNFDPVPKEYSYLSELYLSRPKSWWNNLKYNVDLKLKKIVGYTYYINKVNYTIKPKNELVSQWEGSLSDTALKVQETFLKAITNNKLIVEDEYYTKYLIDENGKERSSTVESIAINANEEYRDFKMVVKYLSEKNINASFIIQPLNPHYFVGLERLNPIMDSITSQLKENKIPYYNMFVDSKENYEPGVLRDVMHLGDYGWMKVNQYIDSLYYGS
ncbi:MAG: D-alanyl-lipoteichoic acid biosynthesis protein DltD [Flavobacteriales bacterium]|jgi:D-alanine transfer protein|nr:D-alanyl-lipoteichoic acid biosynthesis protein DltD [Flavobacteriales bacterium]